jgi:hypothetical protein
MQKTIEDWYQYGIYFVSVFGGKTETYAGVGFIRGMVEARLWTNNLHSIPHNTGAGMVTRTARSFKLS